MPSLKRQLERLIDNAATGAVIVNSQDRIKHISRTAVEMFGYDSAEELIDRRVDMLIPEISRAHHRQHVGSYFDDADSPSMGVGRAVTGLGRDGREFAVEISLSPLPMGGQLQVIAWVQNLEAKQKLEAEVRRYRDQWAHASRISFASEMVAGIAHELSQPLAAIAMFSEAIKLELDKRVDADGQMHQMAEELIGEVVRAGQIVRSLRSFVEHRPTQVAAISVKDLIHRAVRFMENELHCHHVIYQCDVSDDLPRVQAAEIQIAQVLANLIRNALDAMLGNSESERRLIVTADHCAAGVEVSVEDNGPGFSAEVALRAFDSFYSTKSCDQSMGMGLAMCRSIVESHGGKIGISQSSLGGARICFTLLTADDSQRLKKPPREGIAPG